MREVFANTSILQYLHQLGLLGLLERFYGRLVVPPAVVDEIAAGRARGVDLPNLRAARFVEVRAVKAGRLLPLVGRLGGGEREVIALALESSGEALVLLDDALARRHARALGIELSGTLGVLMRAYRESQVDDLDAVISRLEELGFRLDKETRAAVLQLALGP
jgi:predicted nucleic acid-binding protein